MTSRTGLLTLSYLPDEECFHRQALAPLLLLVRTTPVNEGSKRKVLVSPRFGVSLFGQIFTVDSDLIVG